MASYVINPGGPCSYVIPKRRNPPEEKQKKKRYETGGDAKSTAPPRALDKNEASSSTVPGLAAHSNHSRINVWTGSLRFEDQMVESVDLYSPFRDSAKPTGFSSSLDIKLLLTSVDCQKYAPIAELLNSTRPRWHGILMRRPHAFVCLPRSASSSSSSTSRTKTPMQASYFFLTNTFSPLFARIYDRLKTKEMVGMSVLADDTVLFLLPDGTLTERLGIPMHGKPVFHCIFLRPRLDITEDVCRLGLLTLEQIPTEPTPLDKLDGSDEAVLALVDKYRRICGLPTAKRNTVAPLNSLLTPDKPPPGGKPPTPYIPTPGSNQRVNTYGYHKSSKDDWQALLQPPPPPPTPFSSSKVKTAASAPTPRGIPSHASDAGVEATRLQLDFPRKPWMEREPTTSFFKNVLQQVRKINEESKAASALTTDSSTQLSIPPLKTPSPQRRPPLHLPPPPPLPSLTISTTDEQQPLPPPVLPNVPRDPRLLRHTNVAAVDKLKHAQQRQPMTTPAPPPRVPMPPMSRKINEIPMDPRLNSSQSPPSDPRLKRAVGVPLLPPPPQPPFDISLSPNLSTKPTTVPVLNVPPMSSSVVPPPNLSVLNRMMPSPLTVPAPNLGFKRAYGVTGMQPSAADWTPPEEKKKMLTQDIVCQQQLEQFGPISEQYAAPVPAIHNGSDETIIGGDIPMEIDDDDDQLHSPSQATPPPSKMDDVEDKDEYLEEEDDDIEDDAVGKKPEKFVNEGKMEHDEKAKDDQKERTQNEENDKETNIEEGSGRKSPQPTDMVKAEEIGIQSPISLVRSLIPSPLPNGSPKSERRAKVPVSASLNASGFGFDFLNWNASSDSPAKEAQLDSPSSSNLSSVFRPDETFNVEELLKQVEEKILFQ